MKPVPKRLIKEPYWQRREYRDTITSDMIYRAVLQEGVRTIAQFEQLIRQARILETWDEPLG